MVKKEEFVFPQANEQRYVDPIHGIVTPSQIFGPAPGGLTKREYFAAMAMQGYLTQLKIWNSVSNRHFFMAHESILAADALISLLEKVEKDE